MMRWSLLFSFFLVLGLLNSLNTHAQTVTLKKKNASLNEILLDIYRQTKHYYYGNTEVLKNSKKVTINVKNVPLKTALDICFRDQPLQYTLNDGVIVVTERKSPVLAAAPPPPKPVEEEIEDTTARELDKVQVIGYGTTTRRFSTGNVHSVDFKVIERQAITNPILALQARVPGLLVTQTNGLPGSPVNVQIRGRNSIAANNDPLYIIDGVPFTSAPVQIIGGPHGDGTTNYGSPLNLVSPTDIESIEILKDADATAIYGSRGANGVILITTRKAKDSKFRVSAEVNRGFGRVTKVAPLMNTQQYLQMRRDALRNSGLSVDASNAPDLVTWDTTKYTDWQDWFIGATAETTRGNISLSGGNDQHKILFNTGYHHETTVLPGDTRYRRGNFHLNHNYISKNKKLKVSSSAFVTLDNNRLSGSINGILAQIVSAAPNFPVYGSGGKYYWWSDLINPVAALDSYYKGQTKNVNLHTNIEYSLLKGLRLRASIGHNRVSINELRVTPASAQRDMGITPTGNSIFGKKYVSTLLVEPQMVYNSTLLGGKFEFLIGSTVQRNVTEGDYAFVSGFQSDRDLEKPEKGTIILTDSVDILYKYISGFARVTSNWNDKYIVNVNLRRDGSSRFGPGKQFGNFFSTGVAWIFSSEEFIRNFLSFLSYGKLRASYGTTGNDGIADYGFLNNYAPVLLPYGNIPAISPERPANKDYKWEVNRKFEFAMEAGFLRNRLFLNSTFFYHVSSDQLLSYQLPSMTGFVSQLANVPAKVVNKGVEIEINTVNIHSGRFKWRTYLNLTLPKNYLKSYSDLAISNYANDYAIGQPLDNISGLLFKGIDPLTGAPEFHDLNNDGTITPASSFVNGRRGDRVVFAQLRPKWYAGLANNIVYKNLELDLTFQYINQDGYNLNRLYSTAGTIKNTWAQFSSYWTPQNPDAQYPAPLAFPDQPRAHYAVSDKAAGASSFLRLKNVFISYKIPIRGKSLQLYMQGQNLLTFSNYKGYDPETSGNVLLMIPPLKSINVGAKIVL